MATGVSYDCEDDYIYYYYSDQEDVNWEDELNKELDIHWQLESVDYGRMSVRRFSQELVGQSVLARGTSFELASLSEFDLSNDTQETTRSRQTPQRWRTFDVTKRSELLRRGSLDVMAQARNTHRPSDEAARGQAAARRFSLGVIADDPQVTSFVTVSLQALKSLKFEIITFTCI